MDDNLQLPPGFRFHPTDEELILQYLSKKVASASCLIANDVDVYSMEPWDLPELPKCADAELRQHQSTFHAPGSKNTGFGEWHFFSRRSCSGGKPTRTSWWRQAVANEVSRHKDFTSASATWHVASAACHHMTGNRNLLTDLVPVSDHHVDVGDGSRMEVHARGSVKTEKIVLHDVWYIPGLTSNLISASQLALLDLTVGFGRSACEIKSGTDGSVLGRAHSAADGMFELEFLKVPN